MKKQFFLFSVNLIITLTSIFLTYHICLLVAERYFFDKLIYKKSPLHGYYKTNISQNEFLTTDNQLLKTNRLKDLKDLYTVKSNSSKILGLSHTKDYKTIAIIGDSNTFGLGLRKKQRFSYLLERELDKLDSNNEIMFKVLNLSLVGDDFLDNYLKYKKVINSKTIDMSIFAIVANDLAIEKNGKYPNKNLLYEQLTDICGKLPIIPRSLAKYNEELFLISRDESTACFLSYLLNNTSPTKTIFFSTEGAGQEYQHKNNYSQNDYYDYALFEYSQAIRKSKHKLLNPWVGSNSNFTYQNTQISEKEHHPNQHLHQCFAYYLTQEIIKTSLLGDTLTQEDKQEMLCQYEKKIAKEISALLKKKLSLENIVKLVKMLQNKRRLILIGIIGLELTVIAVIFSWFYQRKDYSLKILGYKISGKQKQQVVKIEKKNLIFPDDNNYQYYYELTPNYRHFDEPDWLGYRANYTWNSDGLNDTQDYQLEKAKNTFRIITLGDSFTYGQYVDTKTNWTEVLERLLRTNINNSKKYEVINLGMPGFDIPFTVKRFKEVGTKYKPDLVIWFESGFGFSRFSELTGLFVDKCREENLKEKANSDRPHYCWEEAHKRLHQQHSQNDLNQILTKKIDEFFDIVQTDKVLYVCHKKETFNDNQLTLFNLWQKNHQEANFEPIIPPLSKNQRLADGHPNRQGHKLIARTIYKFLIEESFID